MDVNDEKSVDAAIKKIVSDCARIDVLVNNAGYGQFGCLEDVTVDEFREQFETNFFSIVNIIQQVSPINEGAKIRHHREYQLCCRQNGGYRDLLHTSAQNLHWRD